MLFLAAVPASGGVFHPVFTVVGVLLAILVTLLPETNAALGLVLYLGGLWMVSTSGRLDLWTLAAALLLFALHLACTLSSYGPPGLRLDAGPAPAVARADGALPRRGGPGLGLGGRPWTSSTSRRRRWASASAWSPCSPGWPC